ERDHARLGAHGAGRARREQRRRDGFDRRRRGAAALPMQKGDPDWSKTQSSANGESAGTTPGWARTVPTAPDEPIPETQASATAESAPAPPQETDIWPPEPPTEKAMPAWPPPSELEEPSTPAQVIPSWPDSFAPATEEPTLPAPAAKAAAPEPKTVAREQKR